MGLWVYGVGEWLRVRPLLGAGLTLYLLYRLPVWGGMVGIGLLWIMGVFHPLFRILTFLGILALIMRPSLPPSGSLHGIFRIEEDRVVAWRSPGDTTWHSHRVQLQRSLTPPGTQRVGIGRLNILLGKGRFYGTLRDPKPVKGLGAAVRRGIDRRLRSLYPPESYGLMVALLLGNRSQLPEDAVENLKSAGLYHILALSGLHVGFLLGMLWILGISLGFSLSWRYPLLFLGLAIYIWIVGVRPSLLRASLMALIWAVARVQSRPIHYGQVWGGALFASLILFPQWIWDIGFHLSFLATGGIFLVLSLGRISGWMLAFAVSLGASLATWPYLAYKIGHVNLLAPLWNALALPVVALIYAEGMVSLVGGHAFSWVGHYLLQGIVMTAGKLPGQMSVSIGRWEMVGLYLLIGLGWVFTWRTPNTSEA